MSINPYLPIPARIEEIIQETTSDSQDVKTYRLKPKTDIIFRPGQFVECSVPGVGESTFGFASNPLVTDGIELCIKRTGRVTQAIHMLSAGDTLWIRGPFGNGFPLQFFEGHDLFFVVGGLGLAPLRPLIEYVLDKSNRGKFGKINMMIAARSPKDFIFTYDYDRWASCPDVSVYQTIDAAVPGWDKFVGFPNNLIKDIEFDGKNTIGLICGPPIMIKLNAAAFKTLQIPTERIYTTLEMRMTCGLGKCGKCNIGHRYVCLDGPVFSMKELDEMPGEY